MTSTVNQTSVGSSIEGDASHADVQMNQDIAAQWELWSMVIGKTALPRLQQLTASLPTLQSAILSTADGLNLCSVGVQSENVGRVAALNSSLFATSAAQTELMQGDEAAPDDTMVQIASGDTQMVMVSLVQQPLGHLLLMVSARDVPVATVAVNARQAASDIRAWLSGA